MAGDKKKLTPAALVMVRDHLCPNCCRELKEGPHGGLSVNWDCHHCGAKYNEMGPFGWELVTEGRPVDGES